MVKRNKRINISLCISLVVSVVLGGGFLYTAFGATGTSLTMQTTQTTYNVGDTIAVKLYENSGSTQVAGADVTVDFPSTLTYVGVAGNGAFTAAEPPPTVTPGSGSNPSTVEIERVYTPPPPSTSYLEGTELVETVNFTAASAGSADLTYGSASQINRSSDGGNDVASTSGVNLTIQTPPTGGGSGSPTGGGSPPGSAPPAAGPGKGSGKGNSVNVNTGNGTGANVPNGGTADVSTPVDVQPATVQTQGVKKIEYYLDGTLVATEKVAPYTYHVDTTKLSDGAHTLVTKTYYTNGSTKSSTQHLFVTDGIKTSKTSPAWAIPPVVIVMLVVAAFLYTHFRRPRLLHATAQQGETLVGGKTPKAPKTIDVDILGNIHGHVPPAPSTVIQPDSHSSTDPSDEKKA